MKTNIQPSAFLNLKGIEYFNFEEDFMEENVRCIPMVVRSKMDLAGIKLKLSEWGRFSTPERLELALLPTISEDETIAYRIYLEGLIQKHTGKKATEMTVEQSPAWKELSRLPEPLKTKLAESGLGMSVGQWQRLTDIQRFALLKLCRPGHENKNFPKAFAEFGLQDRDYGTDHHY